MILNIRFGIEILISVLGCFFDINEPIWQDVCQHELLFICAWNAGKNNSMFFTPIKLLENIYI